MLAVKRAVKRKLYLCSMYSLTEHAHTGYVASTGIVIVDGALFITWSNGSTLQLRLTILIPPCLIKLLKVVKDFKNKILHKNLQPMDQWTNEIKSVI